MARKKKVLIAGVTREQMEEAFAQYCLADAETNSIVAQMEKQFVTIREKHADRLAELEEIRTEAFEIIQAYATENKEVLFSKRKSLETVHGIIGFRTGTPKLATKKGFTWAAVLELLKSFGKDYIRTVEEPAKDKLLANREDDACKEIMEKCGVIVKQDESFYIEPKKEKED